MPYTDPTTLSTNPDDPVTSELMTAAIQNPVAIVEGQAGAPRPAISPSRSGSNTAVYTLFDRTMGIEFFIDLDYNVSAGNTGELLIEISKDGGATYPDSFAIISITVAPGDPTVTREEAVMGFFDFATGEVLCSRALGAIPNSDDTITHVRFRWTVGGTMRSYITRNGGRASST